MLRSECKGNSNVLLHRGLMYIYYSLPAIKHEITTQGDANTCKSISVTAMGNYVASHREGGIRRHVGMLVLHNGEYSFAEAHSLVHSDSHTLTPLHTRDIHEAKAAVFTMIALGGLDGQVNSIQSSPA